MDLQAAVEVLKKTLDGVGGVPDLHPEEFEALRTLIEHGEKFPDGFGFCNCGDPCECANCKFNRELDQRKESGDVSSNS